MIINNIINIYQGGTLLLKAYQGDTVVWDKSGIPAWPKEYFHPEHEERGVILFFNDIPSGSELNWRWKSDDDEGEGGDYQVTFEIKEGIFRQWSGSYSEYPDLSVNADFKGWISFGTHYDMNYQQWGNLLGYNPKGMIINTYQSYGGNSFNYDGWSNTGLTDFELFGVMDNLDSDYVIQQKFINKMPNLTYFFNEKSGSTYTLTGSTSWTKESMKFTEYYSPHTTFIVNDNSYWRAIIDWDIAEDRNVIFKDTNGNVMHR